MAYIEIYTRRGKKKCIKGQARALLLKKQVREAFDLKMLMDKEGSFHGLCGQVAKDFALTPTRVAQIMKFDFEYTVNNFRNGKK